MTVQDWFEKRKEAQIQRRALEAKAEVVENPELWTKCVHCDAQILKSDIEENMMVCPVCDYHFRINARTRIKQLFDENSFEEMFSEIKPTDPLEFVDTESYKDRVSGAVEKTTFPPVKSSSGLSSYSVLFTSVLSILTLISDS